MEILLHPIMWFVATLVGGVLGAVFGPGFSPWCWYGLCVGVFISVGIWFGPNSTFD